MNFYATKICLTGHMNIVKGYFVHQVDSIGRNLSIKTILSERLTETYNLAPIKVYFVSFIFLFLHKNICCGSSLDCCGYLMSTTTHVFMKKRFIIIFCQKKGSLPETMLIGPQNKIVTVIFFLPSNLNICFGCSKEPSH